MGPVAGRPQPGRAAARVRTTARPARRLGARAVMSCRYGCQVLRIRAAAAEEKQSGGGEGSQHDQERELETRGAVLRKRRPDGCRSAPAQERCRRSGWRGRPNASGATAWPSDLIRLRVLSARPHSPEGMTSSRAASSGGLAAPSSRPRSGRTESETERGEHGHGERRELGRAPQPGQVGAGQVPEQALSAITRTRPPTPAEPRPCPMPQEQHTRREAECNRGRHGPPWILRRRRAGYMIVEHQLVNTHEMRRPVGARSRP